MAVVVAMEAEEEQEEEVAKEVPELLGTLVATDQMVLVVMADQVEMEEMEAVEDQVDQEVEEEMEVTLVLVASVLFRRRIHDCSC